MRHFETAANTASANDTFVELTMTVCSTSPLSLNVTSTITLPTTRWSVSSRDITGCGAEIRRTGLSPRQVADDADFAVARAATNCSAAAAPSLGELATLYSL